MLLEYLQHQGGAMRRFRRSWRRAFRAFVLSFAVAAVLAGPASAQVGNQMPPGYAPDVEAELAIIEAPSFSPITSPAELYAGRLEPSNVEGPYRAHIERNDGVAAPQHEVTSAAASSDGVDRDALALGLGLGLILATACAVFVAALRSDASRAAHA
jgi:hypothetical protein